MLGGTRQKFKMKPSPQVFVHLESTDSRGEGATEEEE